MKFFKRHKMTHSTIEEKLSREKISFGKELLNSYVFDLAEELTKRVSSSHELEEILQNLKAKRYKIIDDLRKKSIMFHVVEPDIRKINDLLFEEFRKVVLKIYVEG